MPIKSQTSRSWKSAQRRSLLRGRGEVVDNLKVVGIINTGEVGQVIQLEFGRIVEIAAGVE
jgi:hypothetical protein